MSDRRKNSHLQPDLAYSCKCLFSFYIFFHIEPELNSINKTYPHIQLINLNYFISNYDILEMMIVAVKCTMKQGF